MSDSDYYDEEFILDESIQNQDIELLKLIYGNELVWFE